MGMNRSEAAAIASRKSSENAKLRRLRAAADALRAAGWTVVEPATEEETHP